MRIVFLHISDLHIKDKSAIHVSRVQALINSLNEFPKFDGVVLVLSGDIAAKGLYSEYKLASKLIGSLISGIKERYPIDKKDIKLLVVPGNHDIHYLNGHRPNADVVKYAFENNKDGYLDSETSNMTDFMRFANQNICFLDRTTIGDGKLYSRKILHFSAGYAIEANLLNTAPFSCSHDDGFHYVPNEVIGEICKPSIANISIVVMHHSPEWFNFIQRKDLGQILSQRCCIAFFGHEHMSESQQIISEKSGDTVYQSGGAWWQENAPDRCEYYASVFDTNSSNYSVYRYTWDGACFSSSSVGNYILSHKPLNGVSLMCSKEYLTSISKDNKHPITNDFADYYVFLKLRTAYSSEMIEEKYIDSLNSLISFISDKHYVAIKGGANSGKTTLLKRLFRTLYLKNTVLYCGTDDITGRNAERIIKELVETTYGDHAYTAFKAIPSSNKIILIDDLHRIVPKHINKFLNEIKQQFGTIVFATDDVDKFDVVQELRNSIQTDEEFHQLYLTRLYASNRIELITKIVKKSCSDTTSCDSLVRPLEQCLSSYKMSFSTDIDFVVQFASYYCSHFNELDYSDKNVFSKVFESSIEREISDNLRSRKENASDIIVALSEVALYVHFHMEYPITEAHIKDTIKAYCDYYDNNYITPSRFIEITVESGILISSQNEDSYRFKSKDHLAYFVAKAVNRRYHDNGEDKYLRQIVNQSCFGINGDILLFLTYISDNVAIVRLLLEQESNLVNGWAEFDILNITAKYLKSTCMTELTAPMPDQRSKDLENISIVEEKLIEEDAIHTIDIYDYDITRVDDFGNQIMRAFLGLKTLSRSFSSFFSILPASDKKRVAHEMFRLPNAIFARLSVEIDLNAKELVDDLYAQQKSTNANALSKSQILQRLQVLSTHTLLSLYITVAQHGVTQSTIDYLASQDVIATSITYQLERLFFYDKVDDWSNVIKTAEYLYKRNDIGMLRTLCLICLRHMLVYSNGIPKNEYRRIRSKYFPNSTSDILIAREKAGSDSKI